MGGERSGEQRWNDEADISFLLPFPLVSSSTTQPLHLLLARSDYLVHQNSKDPLSIKQVEFNTISSSFGSLSEKVGGLHRFVELHFSLLETCSTVFDFSLICYESRS